MFQLLTIGWYKEKSWRPYLIARDWESKTIRKIEILGREINVRFKKEKELTSKSFYILKIAYERGYFDVRRKITLRRLSKELNIPVSTLDTILRRSIKKIMDEIVK